MTKIATEGANGRLFIVSGPSGVGKDALLDRMFARVPGIVRSVSATTRSPRAGEVDGRDYHFFTHARFEADIQQNLFLEYARYGPNLYGTPKELVQEQRACGLDVVLKIEVQGARAVREMAPDAVLIFIYPPSLAELERRLRNRATDSEIRISERLSIAQTEMDCIPHYDYQITNDDIVVATDALCSIVIAERHRVVPAPSSA